MIGTSLDSEEFNGISVHVWSFRFSFHGACMLGSVILSGWDTWVTKRHA